LQDCQIFLPPQELLHFRSDSGDHVISVHDNVNKCV
jgi:hypothetical protein